MNNEPFYPPVFSRRISVVISIVALLSGSILYFFLRPPNFEYFQWVSSIDLDPWFGLTKKDPSSLSLLFPQWIIYSLPNGLWAFSYALLMMGIWYGSNSWLKYFWLASIPLLVFGFEILQFTETIRGTFCIQDILFGMAGIIAGIILGRLGIKSKNHEEQFT